ncbi:MAG TPA: DUF998 domain-containing protein [Ktedonobacterales bacterium]
MLVAHTLIAVSLAALALYAALLVALHLPPTGLNPLRDPVSLYAAGRWGWLYALAQGAAGLCALGMAWALILLGAALPVVGLAALVVLGLARLALITVPARLSDRDTPPGAPLSRRVVIHQFLAVLSFGAIALTAITLTAPLIAWPGWRGPAAALVAVAVYTPLAVILFPVSGAVACLRPYFGLFQRAIYAGIILWQALALLPLAR